MGYPGVVTVSDRDRDYLRRLGALKAQSHHDATTAHLARSLAERLAASVALMLRHLPTTRPRVDDPSPFYERARRLGLYRP
jgi:primosomal protein N''